MGIKHNPADSSCLEETPKLNAVLRREKGCKFLPICTVDEGGGRCKTCYYTLDCLERRRWVHRPCCADLPFLLLRFKIFAFMKNKGCKKNSQVYFLSPSVSSLPINSAQLTSYQSIHSAIQKVQNIQSRVLEPLSYAAHTFYGLTRM